MQKYEVMAIMKGDASDADVQKVADRYKAVIEESGGTVEKASKWEKRKLAYEIEGQREGNYVLFNFEADQKLPLELNRLMRISDDIIRHRIFKVED